MPPEDSTSRATDASVPALSTSSTATALAARRETYLPQLQELETPVPDLAATLITQAERANSDSIRGQGPSVQDEEPSIARRLRSAARSSAEAVRLTRQRRHPREITSYERNMEGGRPDDDAAMSNVRSYGDRVPLRQSLYDWAPMSGEDSGPSRHHDWTVPLSLYEPEPPWPATSLATVDDAFEHDAAVASHSTALSTPMTSSMTSRVLAQDRTFRRSDTIGAQAETQASRNQSPRASSREPNELEVYMLEQGWLDRRRQRSLEREPSRLSRLLRPPSSGYGSNRRQGVQPNRHSASVDAFRQFSLDAYRQRYLSPTSISEPPLEKAVKYLERVRHSQSKEESLAAALDSGITQRLTRNADGGEPKPDFLLDTSSLPAPPESSWLRVGAVFEGMQHASGGPNTITRRLPPSSAATTAAAATPGAPTNESTRRAAYSSGPSPTDPPSRTTASALTAIRLPPSSGEQPLALAAAAAATAAATAAAATAHHQHREDKWPVKVTIQAVDHVTMQLSGEMEAFDVPDRSAPNGKSSITTYLEGEIIDLNMHTLETKSFRASPRIDSTYWRKLMPFRDCDDADMVEKVLSKAWLTQHMSNECILMRWKEKCFITPSDQRLGLTISGFYYVSLRRSDGFIEGLYYDPASAPYQHLILRPVRRMFPTYEFR